MVLTCDPAEKTTVVRESRHEKDSVFKDWIDAGISTSLAAAKAEIIEGPLRSMRS
jgi:hypothetical protein